MTRRGVGGAALLVLFGVAALATPIGRPDPSEALVEDPAGAATVRIDAPGERDRPSPRLTEEDRARYFAGRALAGQPWVPAPSVTDARDGLGPLFNAATCLSCHPAGGAAPPPLEDGALRTGTTVRFGADPTYGAQLQTHTIDVRGRYGGEDGVRAEGRARVQWQRSTFRYPDGEKRELRAPEVVLEDLAYGSLAPETRPSLRHAPPLFGAGLLAAIPSFFLEQRTDPEDADGDEISGRRGPGRFGWKAEQAHLRAQTALAFRRDMGITSRQFPDQPCVEARCRTLPSGAGADGVEISEALLDLVVDYVASVGVPRKPLPTPAPKQIVEGARRFIEAGCDGCHVTESVRTKDARPSLDGLDLRPFTDLLLHDLGPGLDDGSGGDEAREWRTPPLWGMSARSRGLLHDARARSVEEAVLWHGGEAEASRVRFAEWPRSRREALLAFVEAL